MKYSSRARADLKAIFTYIRGDSKHYAEKIIQEIVERTDSLSLFLKRGRIVPEVNQENIREIFIYSYRIIYEILDGDVYILTIVHGKRNLTAEDILN